MKLVDIRDCNVVVGSGAETFRLDVVNFSLSAGDRVALIGPSGSGKSLFVECLALIRPMAGSGRFTLTDRTGRGLTVHEGDRVSRDGQRLRYRRQEIGLLLQNGGLLRSLSAAENIALPARIAGRGEGDVEELMWGLGVGELARRRIRTLSGGQRQRVALARAMIHRPTLLIADEPTSALDRAAACMTMDLLNQSVASEMAAALVVVTHDLALAREYGFEIVTLEPFAETRGAGATIDHVKLAA